ncbi:N-acetyltransferase [Pontibacter sp. JH31]|uniref:N-acetyltransferase n=1 Tax=Pontibacter aquaedesilientis TaxID=2766980 RepID=A0ABR7XDW5_9BACT|nr:GNAT family N-acetyltransferase [Pontibacter aquaedesilientis]MBD1396479.1 N-acetyltransferase [Pontibacter aquaedesilientis]
MKILHDEKELRFYAIIGEEEAELTYTFTEEGHMDFDHTFVPKSHRGKGVADKLVKTGLEHARSISCRIIPSCPVVETYVKRHKEYEDIVCWI